MLEWTTTMGQLVVNQSVSYSFMGPFYCLVIYTLKLSFLIVIYQYSGVILHNIELG